MIAELKADNERLKADLGDAARAALAGSAAASPAAEAQQALLDFETGNYDACLGTCKRVTH